MERSPTVIPASKSETELHIVAVGASAGGLEAIHEFFDHTPDSTNLAFILIQHLSSDHKSLLVELVSKHTHMQVQEARHQLQVQAGYVYVIPNDKMLTMSNGRLLLSDKDQGRGPNTAIDTFLYSLAEDQKNKAIAVILSGTGTDGTKGAGAIKAQGGLVLVQDPALAKFDGMPKSAISANVADRVVPPAAMADEIYSYLDGNMLDGQHINRLQQEAVTRILNAVHLHTNFDFTQYKPATILRRINRRMLQTRQKDVYGYEQLLKQNEEEATLLAKEFLIGVTSFFRDKEAFAILRDEVLPHIIAAKNKDTIKVWVTACSTGQEAYSIAIILDQLIQQQRLSVDVKIFASDVDEAAIAIASKGVYPLSALGNVEADIINQYFIRHPNELTIIPQIRKQIVFARHNILKDPPFINNDFVTCRNLMIYLNPALQQQVLSTLNFSLKKGGYLFLGPSENPTPIKDDLLEINSKWKVYQKQSHTSNLSRPATAHPAHKKMEAPFKAPLPQVSAATQLSEDFRSVLAEEYGFAAAYINHAYEVKEVTGNFKRYLSLPDRLLNLNILRMVPPELSGILSTAFRKVLKENKRTAIKNIRVNSNGAAKVFNITVLPSADTLGQHFMMVVFSEVADNAKSTNTVTDVNALEPTGYIYELEEELKETRHNLQMAIEGLETTNEELQSANEELQSANEELQSSNEELQSLNEELHTLNTEHQLRIKELVELNDDLNNYFRSTDIAQLFVDREMNIRKFNPAAVKMINVIESDIGRPIDNISTNIRLTDLTADVKKVMQDKDFVEKEVQLTNGSFYLMRILPYLRQDKVNDGVVIAFIDISVTKNLNSIIKGVFDSSMNGIMVCKAVRSDDKEINDFTLTTLNHEAEKIFNHKATEASGQSLKQHFSRLTENNQFEKLCRVVNSNETLFTEMVIQKEEHTEWYDVAANKLQDGVIITLTNITHKKVAEEKLRNHYNELWRTKESLKQLNIQLEEKVHSRTKDLAQSEERFRLVVSATNDAIWDWDFANNEIWWSDSFYTLFGYSPDDESVKSSAFLFHMVHDDDRKRVRNSLNQMIHNNGEKWVESYRLKRKDGSYAKVLNRANIMHDEFQTPYRMLGSLMDVTELQEKEEQLKVKNDALQHLIEEFKFVTDFMPQIVWSTQPDGYHDFFNQRWYVYTGLTFEQTKDEGWAQVLHPEDHDKTLAIWNDALQNGTIYETEYRLRDAQGQYRWFLARALPMRNEEGDILKWFGTCTDIHDQKQLADILELKVKERTSELQQANKHLERSNEELEFSNNELLQFASVASHDLKEPLRKIHMFSHIIKDRYLQEQHEGAATYLERIIASSSRMTRLINDLLTYSRLSVASLFEPVDLNTVVQEVLSDLELSIQEKKAIINVGPLPVIEAVGGQMRQVFQNLVFNALKFSREDTPARINIWAANVATLSVDAAENEQGDFCRITIADNGIGFDSQYRNKIFTIFQQLHSRDKYEGTGIGLAITKKIIERHQGIIVADSIINEGTTFTIVLPVHQQQ